MVPTDVMDIWKRKFDSSVRPRSRTRGNGCRHPTWNQPSSQFGKKFCNNHPRHKCYMTTLQLWTWSRL
eukprot:12568909-Prorocentrum_lima.AAC.1